MSVKIHTALSILAVTLLASGCAAISEEQCHAGNWKDRGYSDGVQGRSRSRLMSYIDTCSEYGAAVDRERYLHSYENGLTYYCVPEKGFQLGRDGSSYNAVCSGDLAAGFVPAYEEGRAMYEIESRYRSLVSGLESIESDISGLQHRIKHEELNDSEYKKLRSRLERFKRERADRRERLYRFEREYGYLR